MHPQIDNSPTKKPNNSKMQLYRGCMYCHSGKHMETRQWKEEKKRVCLCSLDICVSVFLGDLTPGSVIVFICDSWPLTQRGLTMQNFPHVYFWKTKLCFVLSLLRVYSVLNRFPFGCVFKRIYSKTEERRNNNYKKPPKQLQQILSRLKAEK